MKKYHCINCKKEISRTTFNYGGKRCRSCAIKYIWKTSIEMQNRNNIGKNNGRFKHGKYCISNHNYCPDCGKEISLISKKCGSCCKKDKKFTEQTKQKMSKKAKGRKLTEEIKRKMSLSRGGTGIPYENTEYGSEFDSSLKEQIRFRDNYKCKICGCSQLENGKQLDVHHIDYNKKNNNINNLIALCKSCHMKTNANRDYWINCKIRR